MRFTEYLIEAPQQGDWIKKQKKSDQQRNRRATQARAAANGQPLAQAAQPNAAKQAPARQQTVNTGLPQRPAATGPDTLNLNGKPVEQNNNGLERRHVDPNAKQNVDMEYVPAEVLKLASESRPAAVELITLLGSMYQVRRRNPQVQFTEPAMVTQSKNNPEMMKALFDAAKTMDLPQLAQMTQEIRRVAAAPGSQNAAPNGMQTGTPQTPGQTPGQKSMLQKMLNWIQQAKDHLSPADFEVVKKRLSKVSKNAKANPMVAGHEQPANRPVVTQG